MAWNDVECVGQESGAKVSRNGLTVTERLISDTVSTRGRITNMSDPHELEEWDVTANLYSLQCDRYNEGLEGFRSFEHLDARAIGMFQKYAMGLVDMEDIWELSAKFERQLIEKDVHPGSKRFESMFNRSMDECEQLELNPFVAYEAKLPDEE